MAESLLNLQTAEGSPTSAGTQTATDLLLPPISMADRLKHFVEEVYDTSPESHLSRFLKVLIGEAGAGGLRKRLLVTRIQQTLQGSHFFDLDKFYGALFGMRRLTAEKLAVNPYGTATVAQWQEAHGRDASYRSRIHQLGRALSYGPTPTGIELAAEAVLAVDCDVYEEYTQADSGYRTYGELEDQYGVDNGYLAMEGVRYSELEGEGLTALETARRVFTVRPKRPITLEESYDLGRVLERIKPADSLVRIEVEGIGLHTPAAIRGLHADSVYWEMVPKVSTHAGGTLDPYLAAGGSPTEQPRPPLSDYQGEAWSYNGDVIGAAGYIQMGGANPANSPTQRIVFFDGTYRDYEPMNAVMGKQFVQAGRVVSDAILVSQPIVRRSGDLAPTPKVYADRMPVDDLVGALKQAPFAPFKENTTQRFWCSPQRPNGDLTEEVLEIRLTGDRLVNYLTYEVSHYPHVASVQVYRQGQANPWQEVHAATVTDSVPRYVSSALDPEQGHPFHSSPGHWIRRGLRFDAVTTSRIRIVLRRHEGLSPQMRAYARRQFMPGRYVEPVLLPYSLALRHIDAGYRAGSHEEAAAASGSTSTDVMGSLVTFVLREEPPDVQGDVGQHLAGLLATQRSQWRCEPQPVSYSVVNLHLDVRNQYGAGQVIDRLYIDPTHIGVHATLYYSNDPEAGDYEGITWTPISRDYVLQKGYMHFPPVRATYLKMEFTNLVAEPYETFMPIIRTVRMFPAGMVMAYRDRQLGMATEAMPEGVSAHLELQRDTPVRYADALTLLRAEAIRTRSTPTEALYPTEPATIERLRSLAHVFGFAPWHQDLGAPRFQYVQPHVYEHIEVRHINKVAYFVGLREIRAYRVDFEADDDTQVYVDHFWDQANIESNGWQFTPNVLYATAPGVVATSRPFGSRHSVRAVQFASQQTEAVQIVPDADFVDPYLSTYEWNDPDYWQKVGDAFVSYAVTEHSVKVHRDVTPPLRAATIAHGLVRPLVEPVFSFRNYSVADDEAVASTVGGIITPLLAPAHDVRVNAAVRVSLDTDLTSPLILQIVTGNDGTVLVEEERTGVAGEMLEWTIHHDMGVFYVPPPPPVVYARRGIVRPVVSDPFPYSTATVIPGDTYTIPADETIQVRLIQRGKSNDQWRVDNLSLFDEGIVWEFSVNAGADWHPARGIRNNQNAVLTFPVPGNALAWRARGMRPGMAVNSLKIRPWYLGPKNARQAGTLRGPNVSTFDQDPPIEEDPDFTTWSLPVPRWWFYANKPYSTLPVEGAPNLTPYARYFVRSAIDDLGVPVEGTWGGLLGTTWGDHLGTTWGDLGDFPGGVQDAAEGTVIPGGP